MLDKNKFKIAERFISLGFTRPASALFWGIYNETKNSSLKLQAILELTTTLSPTEDIDKLIKICTEGMNLAGQLGSLDLKACLMAKKANYLSHYLSLCRYERKKLKLVPQWIGFALENDEKEYNELTGKISKFENEADDLLHKSIKIANEINDQYAKANILSLKGQFYGGKYLDFKMENMKTSKIFLFSLSPRLKDYFLYDRNKRKEMKKYISILRKSFLESAQIFESLNNKLGEANSLFGLAIQLRSTNRFKKVIKFLTKAKKIAQKQKDIALVNQINEFEKSLTRKNRDIKDHFNMEPKSPKSMASLS